MGISGSIMCVLCELFCDHLGDDIIIIQCERHRMFDRIVAIDHTINNEFRGAKIVLAIAHKAQTSHTLKCIYLKLRHKFTKHFYLAAVKLHF